MSVISLFIDAILIINLATSSIINDDAARPFKSKNNSYPTEEYMKNESTSTHAPGSYQVTENVVDIPDDRTPSGPPNPNYAIYVPLNLGNVNKIVEENNTEGVTNKDSNELKSNKISILHIKAEFDGKPEVVPTKENNFHKVVQGFKEYVYCLKEGLVNGIHILFRKNNGNSEFGFEKPSLHDKFHRSFEETDDFEDDVDDFSHEFEDH